MAERWTSDTLTGSSGRFPCFPLTFDDLRSSIENKCRTILAQKFRLEQLWSRTSLTKEVRYAPDGRDGVADEAVSERAVPALNEGEGCEEGTDIDKVRGVGWQGGERGERSQAVGGSGEDGCGTVKWAGRSDGLGTDDPGTGGRSCGRIGGGSGGGVWQGD